MGRSKSFRELFDNNKMYFLLVFLLIFSYTLFKFAYLFQDEFSRLVGVATYLTWHNLFELTSVLVKFSIFIVAFFTYEQSRSLKSILLGSIFMSVGAIELFHTLSFKGMPDFFIDNSHPNRATTFWIISRLLASVGIAASSFIPDSVKSTVHKRVFVIPLALLSIFVLILATYFPDIFPSMHLNDMTLSPAKVYLEYVVIFFFLTAIVKLLIEYTRTKEYLTALMVGAMIFSIFAEFAFVSYSKVYDIYNYLGHVYKFVASFIIFRVTFIHDIRKPYVELYNAQCELKNYTENLDKLVDQRTKQIKKMNETLLEDLEYARDIQKALLPSKLPDEKEVSFYSRYFSAERVSGDFYSIFKIDEENIGFYIGDVSGHGVPAAMLTVFLKQSVRYIKEGNISEREVLQPSAVLSDLYNSFNNTNFKDEVYIVLVYGVYNFKKRELTYASAGLNAAPLVVKGYNSVEEIDIKGFPICKFANYYSGNYENSTIKLNKGDKILFYTDGLVDALNSKGESFSEERLKRVLLGNSRKSGPEMIKTIERSLFDFMDTSKIRDDITFFVMDVK
jgi:sigma-B regulation protein RsbU (phosphoserine phosphatase)